MVPFEVAVVMGQVELEPLVVGKPVPVALVEAE